MRRHIATETSSIGNRLLLAWVLMLRRSGQGRGLGGVEDGSDEAIRSRNALVWDSVAKGHCKCLTRNHNI